MRSGPRLRMRIRRLAIYSLVLAFVLALGANVLAEEEASLQDLASQAEKALRDGRAGDAVAAFESLADRGAIDATLSYDRGLAYALRVHIGAEQPGDLGRAAQGFEEARDLSRDPRLVDDAGRALILVRSEVARRRVLAGDSVEVDPGRSLGRALAGLLTEDTWAAVCATASLALTVGLFARWLGRSPRPRVAGGVVAGVAAPLLLLAAAMTSATRADRLSLREGVVVTANARPTDERGITVPGAHPLPEGARVEVVDVRGAQTRVRFGTLDVWVPAGALRELARAD
jgi:hypothetical protein